MLDISARWGKKIAHTPKQEALIICPSLLPQFTLFYLFYPTLLNFHNISLYGIISRNFTSNLIFIAILSYPVERKIKILRQITTYISEPIAKKKSDRQKFFREYNFNEEKFFNFFVKLVQWSIISSYFSCSENVQTIFFFSFFDVPDYRCLPFIIPSYFQSSTYQFFS